MPQQNDQAMILLQMNIELQKVTDTLQRLHVTGQALEGGWSSLIDLTSRLVHAHFAIDAILGARPHGGLSAYSNYGPPGVGGSALQYDRGGPNDNTPGFNPDAPDLPSGPATELHVPVNPSQQETSLAIPTPPEATASSERQSATQVVTSITIDADNVNVEGTRVDASSSGRNEGLTSASRPQSSETSDPLQVMVKRVEEIVNTHLHKVVESKARGRKPVGVDVKEVYEEYGSQYPGEFENLKAFKSVLKSYQGEGLNYDRKAGKLRFPEGAVSDLLKARDGKDRTESPDPPATAAPAKPQVVTGPAGTLYVDVHEGMNAGMAKPQPPQSRGGRRDRNLWPPIDTSQSKDLRFSGLNYPVDPSGFPVVSHTPQATASRVWSSVDASAGVPVQPGLSYPQQSSGFPSRDLLPPASPPLPPPDGATSFGPPGGGGGGYVEPFLSRYPDQRNHPGILKGFFGAGKYVSTDSSTWTDPVASGIAGSMLRPFDVGNLDPRLVLGFSGHLAGGKDFNDESLGQLIEGLKSVKKSTGEGYERVYSDDYIETLKGLHAAAREQKDHQFKSVVGSQKDGVSGFTERLVKSAEALKQWHEVIDTAARKTMMWGSGVMESGAPDAFSTMMGSFKLLAAQVGVTLVPYMVRLAKVTQDLSHWFGGLSERTKSIVGGGAAIGLGAATTYGFAKAFGLTAVAGWGVSKARDAIVARATQAAAPLAVAGTTAGGAAATGGGTALAVGAAGAAGAAGATWGSRLAALARGAGPVGLALTAAYAGYKGLEAVDSWGRTKEDETLGGPNRPKAFEEYQSILGFLPSPIVNSGITHRNRLRAEGFKATTGSAEMVRLAEANKGIEEFSLYKELKSREPSVDKRIEAHRKNLSQFQETLKGFDQREVELNESRNVWWKYGNTHDLNKIAELQRNRGRTHGMVQDTQRMLDYDLAIKAGQTPDGKSLVKGVKERDLGELMSPAEKLNTLSSANNLLMDFVSRTQPGYFSPDELHKKIQLQAVSESPLQQELNKIQREALQAMVKSSEYLKKIAEKDGVNAILK